MKVLIDIPKEFETDLQDKFKEFFERMIADINYALDKQEPLLCGNYERETAEMFLSAFEKATIIPDDATNGDMIKAMFPNAQIDYHEKSDLVDRYVTVFPKYCDTCQDYSLDWWNASYKKEVEE